MTRARRAYVKGMRFLLAMVLFAFVSATPFHAAMAASKAPVAAATSDHCGSPVKPTNEPKVAPDKCCSPMPPALSPSFAARVDAHIAIRLAEPLLRRVLAVDGRAWEADPPPPRIA